MRTVSQESESKCPRRWNNFNIFIYVQLLTVDLYIVVNRPQATKILPTPAEIHTVSLSLTNLYYFWLTIECSSDSESNQIKAIKHLGEVLTHYPKMYVAIRSTETAAHAIKFIKSIKSSKHQEIVDKVIAQLLEADGVSLNIMMAQRVVDKVDIRLNKTCMFRSRTL